MSKTKINLPVAIIISSAILGFSLYQIQISKQESIERQQATEVDNQKKDEAFANELKCQGLLKDLKARWNNVVGIRYSDLLNTCMVKYTIGGVVEESPVENMQDD